MQRLYKACIWIAVVFYVFGIFMKLFFGGSHILGIPPSAWINQGSIVFLLLAIVLILMHYLPELEE